MMHRVRNATTAIFAFLATVVAHADTARLTDGTQWTMRNADGRTGRIAFNADGTATMRMGPFSMTASWTLEGDTLCITGGRMGTRCSELRPVESGFVGMRNGQETLRLTR